MKIKKNFSTKVAFCLLFALLLSACSIANKTSIPTTFPPTATVVLATSTIQPTALQPSRTPKPTINTPTDIFVPSSTPTQTPTQTALPPSPLSAENTAIPVVQEVLSPNNVHNLIPLTKFGKGTVADIAYSPDGKLFGVASSLGVYLYDNKNYGLRNFFPTDFPVTKIQFSTDLQTFALGFSNGRIETRNIEDGKIIQVFENGDPNNIINLAFSSDGTRLISIPGNLQSIDTDPNIFEWDLTTGKLISTHTLPYRDVTDLSNDSSSIASIAGYNEQGMIELKNTSSWKSEFSIPYIGYVYSLSLSPNGKDLLYEDVANIAIWKSEQPEKTIMMSDVPQYHDRFFADTCQIEADGPGLGSVESGVFSPDGKLIALASRVGVIQIRRASDGAIVTSFPGRADKMAFAPNSRTILISVGDGNIEIRETYNGSLLKRITGHSNGFSSVSFSPDGHLLAAGAMDHLVRIWRLPDGQRALNLETQASQAVFSPDGNLLATGSDHGSVILWNLSNGDKHQFAQDSLEHNDNILTINSLKFTPNGELLIEGSQSCIVQVWDTKLGKSIWNFPNKIDGDNYASNSPVKSIAVSPDNKILAVNYYGTILLYDINNRKVLSQIKNDDIYENAYITFLPDGNHLAFGSSRMIELWDISSSRKVYSVNGSGLNLVTAPNGQVFASSDDEGNIYIWKTDNGQLLNKLQGHRGKISQLAFSFDGKLLASSSSDGTIRLWGVQ